MDQLGNNEERLGAPQEMSRMNIWVPQWIHDDLLAIKKHHGGSVADYVRQSLREFIGKFKQENDFE